MEDWESVVVAPGSSLAEAIAKVDASGLQVALVLGHDNTLLGILTDGNIRRAILAGKSLQDPVSKVMTAQPTTATPSMSPDDMLALMRGKVLHHLPLVDAANRVVGLVTLDELIGAVERPNWVVLMAGGLGTRLLPLTTETPKPLLPIGGKPILETIVESFAAQGFRRIFLSVNYKAEMFRDHFGGGDRWGVQVDYLEESTRLGTAGALSLLADRPTIPIVVMNGDLIARVNFHNMLQFHDAHGAAATMAVRAYDFQVPYGVVRLDGGRIREIEEKPVQKFFVNAGIYTLSPDSLDELPRGTFFDMPAFFERLIKSGKTTVAYPLREHWLDIGQIEEFERAQAEWRGAR
ncbi:MAG: nucleotidyltransferase family protein [Candidatus Sumerlaeota bacterium]|nr:nucleotidyltransferase family protein [Candidatus Sumerlaeota bacterium]